MSQYGPQRQRLREMAEVAASSAAREAGVAFDPEAVTVTKAAKRKARGKAYAERRDMLAQFERAQEIKKILEDLIQFRLCAPAVPCVGVALFPCPPKKRGARQNSSQGRFVYTQETKRKIVYESVSWVVFNF